MVQLRIGVRVLVTFTPSYYRGDGTSEYGTYIGYDKKDKKYKVRMDRGRVIAVVSREHIRVIGKR